MQILGIDPGLLKTGWGIITKNSSTVSYLGSGIIRTKPSKMICQRIFNVIFNLEQIVENYKPNVVVMEESFINNNAISSLKLGYVRGAIMSLVGKYKLDYMEFKPNTIKKTIVGVGHAKKQQVLYMVKLIFPRISITSLDEADAIATAYTFSCHK